MTTVETTENTERMLDSPHFPKLNAQLITKFDSILVNLLLLFFFFFLRITTYVSLVKIFCCLNSVS